MSNELLLNKKLDDLVNLLMVDGVQPGELADNIFLSPYVQVVYKKVNEEVVGELHFEEKVYGKYGVTILRYFYSNDKKVYRIEEEVGGLIKTLWDRDCEEMNILEQILEIMQELYNPAQIEKFILTLPPFLGERVKDKFREIAS